jgi:hypothetical protein
MGYRYYLGVMEKSDYEELSNRYTKEQILDKEFIHSSEFIGPYEFSKEIYENMMIGGFLNKDEQELKSFFKVDEVNEKFWDWEYTLSLWSHEDLSNFVEYCRSLVYEHYKDLTAFYDKDLKDDREFDDIKSFLRSKKREWDKELCSPYYLDPEKKALISSWSLEYGVFELVRIYKDVVKNDKVIYVYGY